MLTRTFDSLTFIVHQLFLQPLILLVGFILYCSIRVFSKRKVGHDITDDLGTETMEPVRDAIHRSRRRVYRQERRPALIASAIYEAPHSFITVDSAFDELSAPTRSFVLAHELAHVEFKDPAVAALFPFVFGTSVGLLSFACGEFYGFAIALASFVCVGSIGLLLFVWYMIRCERRADAYGASLVGTAVASHALNELRTVVTSGMMGPRILSQLDARRKAMDALCARDR